VKIDIRRVCQEIGGNIPLRFRHIAKASFTPGNPAKNVDGRKGFGIGQEKFGYEYHGTYRFIKLMGDTFRQDKNFLVGHPFKVVITEGAKDDARESDQRRDQEGIDKKKPYFELHKLHKLYLGNFTLYSFLCFLKIENPFCTGYSSCYCLIIHVREKKTGIFYIRGLSPLLIY
jgi:hypothetical protein